ncbi:hypothetical protein EMMF5_003056 [Cystobasidiomycetes sp. EMM_F5]
MSADDGHLRVTYNDIHKLIKNAAEKIKTEFRPDLFVAIGGGGFAPSRILRTFCKIQGGRNIPIQAIGLSLYEQLGSSTAEQIGKEVVRTQWLDFSTLGRTPLLGRRILIVDEVDDTRTTLAYAVRELQADLAKQLESLSEEQRARTPPTEFGIFVVHNKLKPKAAQLPDSVMYFSGEDLPDVWVDYPWEMVDIDKHDALAAQQASNQAKANGTAA